MFKKISWSVAAYVIMALMFVGCGSDSAARETSAAVKPTVQSSIETKNTASDGANGMKGKKILRRRFAPF